MSRPPLLETVLFFNLFDWVLTKEELFKLTRFSQAEAETLLTRSFLSARDNYLYLSGQERLLSLRREREIQAAKLWAKTRRIVSGLQLFPFVRAVFVANNLAYHNARSESDIDLLIIIRRGRLWFTRLLISLWLLLLGEKRQGARIAERFCLSFFLTDDHLDLSPVKLGAYDPYLNFWLYLLAPVFDYGVLPKLVESNSWLKDFFPHYGVASYQAPLSRVTYLSRLIQALFELLFYYLTLGPLWEKVGRFLQLARIERKRKSEPPPPAVVVSDQMLKFHPTDRRQQIKEELASQLKALNETHSA